MDQKLIHRAIAAAHAASSAASELLRYAREGASCNRPFGMEDPIAELVDALRLAISVEDPYLEQQPCYASEREFNIHLAAAIARWRSDAGATTSDEVVAGITLGPACHSCGCTENDACLTDDGPCAWAAPNLCTACAGKEAR